MHRLTHDKSFEAPSIRACLQPSVLDRASALARRAAMAAVVCGCLIASAPNVRAQRPLGIRDEIDTSWAEGAVRPIADARVEVMLKSRTLLVLSGADTLRRASIAVASGARLAFAGRAWRFAAPRGRRQVLAKRTDPVWRPPDWHYAETAREHGLHLRRLTAAGARLRDGSRLVIRDSTVGLVRRGDTTFLPLPVEEHVVFDSTLFIPPVATHNRQLSGELGRYALDLGDGYLLHGTTDSTSIGTATTHGCIRLSDDDLEWVYEHVPVGATVTIH